MRRSVVMFIVLVCCAVALAGCSSQGGEALSPDGPQFAGLDPTVVAEVLSNATARHRITEEPPQAQKSMAQGIAINFTVCRDALRVYQDWLATGVAPALNPLPTPTNPLEPSHSGWETSYADLVARAQSGEIEQLRHWLTGTGSCGPWIPATPGDAIGPTVADVVAGTSG